MQIEDESSHGEIETHSRQQSNVEDPARNTKESIHPSRNSNPSNMRSRDPKEVKTQHPVVKGRTYGLIVKLRVNLRRLYKGEDGSLSFLNKDESEAGTATSGEVLPADKEAVLANEQAPVSDEVLMFDDAQEGGAKEQEERSLVKLPVNQARPHDGEGGDMDEFKAGRNPAEHEELQTEIEQVQAKEDSQARDEVLATDDSQASAEIQMQSHGGVRAVRGVQADANILMGDMAHVDDKVQDGTVIQANDIAPPSVGMQASQAVQVTGTIHTSDEVGASYLVQGDDAIHTSDGIRSAGMRDVSPATISEGSAAMSFSESEEGIDI